MCMILWDVVSSRALLRLRKKLPFEKYMETPLHNEQAAQWFQKHARAVSCHQVARHAPNHPASVRTLTMRGVPNRVTGVTQSCGLVAL